MCYHEGCSTFGQTIKGFLNHGLTFSIQRAGGFIQKQDRGITQERPRDGDALTLPSGQGRPARTGLTVNPLGKLRQELRDMGVFQGRVQSVFPRILHAKKDIVSQAFVEKKRVLCHH